MNFDTGADRPKRWTDIWGAGQGIGAVKKVVPASNLIDRIAAEYVAATDRLSAQVARFG
ncbi:hypothetical protein [Sulfitobacter dubius]|uniref:hypothetical protein n=1 Tax=Sulfitobacter dubius TaxID=218673 RepID=UPI0022B04A3A|nr:hypothetical protein [Sulfitobacter dubius]MCZ4368731.1 hypothetical protein [Sulfitobacter dubius]